MIQALNLFACHLPKPINGKESIPIQGDLWARMGRQNRLDKAENIPLNRKEYLLHIMQRV